VKIFEGVVTVKLRESFTRPLHSSTRTSCTDTIGERVCSGCDCTSTLLLTKSSNELIFLVHFLS